MKFLSVDPVIAEPGSAQAHNAYAYVLNNPTRYTDPSGFTPHGGTLVSRWDGGWMGAPPPNQSMMERPFYAAEPPLYLPRIDLRVPSVEVLDDAKAQPDARHTNDIGQSSGSSKSALTSLLTKASGSFNEGAEMVPCGPHLGCRASKAFVGSQLDSMLNASAAYDRYSPVSKLAAASFAINEFVPFVSAGEGVNEARSRCSSGTIEQCGTSIAKAGFHTLAAGASIYSLGSSASGLLNKSSSILRRGIKTAVDGAGRDMRPAELMRRVMPGEKFSDLLQEMKAIQIFDGVEMNLVRFKGGQQWLVRGGSTGTTWDHLLDSTTRSLESRWRS